MEEEDMTVEEMQRLVDIEMREGRTWEEALGKLAYVLGIHPPVAGEAAR